MGLRSPIFISYAHKDQHYLDKLLIHLEPLRMQDQVCAWSDKNIEAGSDWRGGMRISILNARIYILLISKHYLASDFIRKSELPTLIAEKNDLARPVIPVLLSPCLYDLASFKYPDPVIGPGKFDLAAIQFFNDINKPLSMLSEHKQDIVFVNLGKKLYEITHPPSSRSDFKNVLFIASSPDSKRKLSITEARGSFGLYTEVLIGFGESAKGVYAIPGINLDIKTYWKDNITVVIETGTRYQPYKKYLQLQILDEVVNVEYIEN